MFRIPLPGDESIVNHLQKSNAAVISLCALLAALSSVTARAADAWITFPGGEGPGKGKQVVLVSGDEEYRSEEALPQLAKILSKHHGFQCTVLFAIDPKDGTINPNQNDNIPGLEALATADLMIIATRFRNLPDDQMQKIVDYVESGRPIIGMRTATHAFNLDGKSKFNRYTFNHGEWKGGFGRQVLGETWVNHHGGHGSQSTRGIIAPGQESNPILRGIKNGDVWGPTDVYEVHLPDDCTALVLGQVVEGMKPGDPPATGKKNDPMMPVAWTKTYTGTAGKPARIFTTTMGAATDLEAAGTRRMLVNAAYWAVGLEDKIAADANVELVGPYKPTSFGFNGYVKGIKPEQRRVNPRVLPTRAPRRWTPLDRVRTGAIVLGAIIVASVVGYHLAGRSWLDALYMVVITVSSVGFGETSQLSAAEQWLTMAVILFGISAAAFTLGGLLQMMVEGEIDRVLATGRNTRAIDKLDGHVIICGFGRLGHMVAEQLRSRNRDLVVVDVDDAMIADALAQGYLTLAGDATDEDVLIRAGVHRARCLVTALSNDAANVFITLTSRNLNERLQIIARSEHQTTQKKLIQAGANRVVLPEAIGAARIATMITHPSTVELMEFVDGRSVLDVEVAEMRVPTTSSLAGHSIREADIGKKHQLLVVGVKQVAGDIVFNPGADFEIRAGDILIVMGRVDDLERFRTEFGL